MHRAAGPVELDGVGEQVDQHLAQPHRVGHHAAGQRAAVQLHLAQLRFGGHQRQRGGHEVGAGQRLLCQAQAAGLGAREFEHVVDQRQQVAPGVVDVRQPALAAFARLGAVVAAAAQQLREAEHRVQRRAQLMADARHGLRLGLALGHCQRTFLQRLRRHVRLGAVPVDADAPLLVALRVEQRRRERGDPALAPVGQHDAEAGLPRLAVVHARAVPGHHGVAVVGVQAGDGFFRHDAAALGRDAAQAEHLRVPDRGVAAVVHLPAAQAERARRQRHAFDGVAQLAQRLLLLGDVEHHAFGAAQRRVALARDDAAHHQPAQRAVRGPHDAELAFQRAVAAVPPGQRLRTHARQIVGVHAAVEPVVQAQRAPRRVQAEQREHAGVPARQHAAGLGGPQPDARGLGRRLQPARGIQRAAAAFHLGRHVEHHAHEAHRRAVGAALQRAPQQHVAQPVRVLVAQLHVAGRAGAQRQARRGVGLRAVVGVDAGPRLFEREALGPPGQADDLAAARVEHQALGGHVEAPQRDVAQVQRHLQLGAQLLGPVGELVHLGVVDVHAQHALRLPGGVVEHLPLRVHVAHLAVGPADAHALAVRARVPQRVAEGAVAAVGVEDHRRRDAVGRRGRTGRRLGQAPDAVHVGVPAAQHRDRVAFEHADAAEVLHQVEPLLQRRDLRAQRGDFGVGLAGHGVCPLGRQGPQAFGARLGSGSRCRQTQLPRGARPRPRARHRHRHRVAGLQPLPRCVVQPLRQRRTRCGLRREQARERRIAPVQAAVAGQQRQRRRRGCQRCQQGNRRRGWRWRHGAGGCDIGWSCSLDRLRDGAAASGSILSSPDGAAAGSR